MEQYDIIIIGAGPGGLTAGIYAGRQGTKNLIIDRDLAGGLGREVPAMENYPGFDNISGLELIEKIKAQAVKNCDLKEMEEVTEVIKTDGDYRFTVKTDKDEYQTKSIILARVSSTFSQRKPFIPSCIIPSIPSFLEQTVIQPLAIASR